MSHRCEKLPSQSSFQYQESQELHKEEIHKSFVAHYHLQNLRAPGGRSGFSFLRHAKQPIPPRPKSAILTVACGVLSDNRMFSSCTTKWWGRCCALPQVVRIKGNLEIRWTTLRVWRYSPLQYLMYYWAGILLCKLAMLDNPAVCNLSSRYFWLSVVNMSTSPEVRHPQRAQSR